MNRFALILAFMIAFPLIGNAQRKRAFMVGISKYHTNGYKVWNDIHGAEDVDLLSPVLRKDGFTIQTLTNGQATYDAILKSLNTFIQKTKHGDIIYLHFSCHGQPVEDLNGDEDDGWDEAIVPIDAGKTYNPAKYKGGKHLIDDILNVKIESLRKAIGPRGILYITLDACHSGNSYRPDGTIRGTDEGFSKTGKIYNSRKVQRMISEKSKSQSHYIKDKDKKGLSHVVLIEACQPWEINSEIYVDGYEYGSLSYHMFQLLTMRKKNNKGLNTNGRDFITEIISLVAKSKYWPRNEIEQNLIVESSYK